MGGRKFYVTPLDKIWIFSTPGQKRVFSLPPRTQYRIFLPLSDMFFLDLSNFTSIRQFSPPILPPLDSYLSILPPMDSIFHQFYPLGQFILTILPPSDIFPKMLLLGHFFLRPPWTKIAVFLPPGQKQGFLVPPGQGDLTPRTKMPFPPPPVSLME